MYSTSSPGRFPGRLAFVSLMLLGSTACNDRDFDLLAPADFPSEPVVFQDFLTDGIDFQAFGGSKLDAFSVDPNEAFRGDNSMRIDVPAPGDPTGGFAGGAFVAPVARDLSDYNALSFWARGSLAGTIDVIGVGNDNTGTSRFQTTVASQVRLTSNWTRYILPIPDPSKLTREAGMLWFAEGAENGQGYTIWIDEVEFVDLGTIGNPRPALPDQELAVEVGGELVITGTTVTYDVNGSDVVVDASPNYFSFSSSDESVASIDPDGGIELVGSGTATIRGSLRGIEATGEISLRVAGPPSGPAPTPTRPGSEVTSLFSDAYDDSPVDTWSTVWDNADVEDVQIGGDNVKKYTNAVFAGVEMLAAPVDAATREGIHIDLWVNDPSDFRLKLVDLGPDGVFGGNNESEGEVLLTESSMPALAFGQWNSIDIPFSEFAGGLPNRGALGQMIFSGANSTFYIDNVYFYGEIETESEEPTEAAPTPAYAPTDVISMFSNAYTNVPVDTWSAVWDNATVEDVQIAGDDTKKYTGLVFAGVEAVSSTIDVTSMTHFSMDVWTPEPTDGGEVFKILLRDFGPDGGFDGGDDTLHEVVLNASSTPAIATGGWVTLDIPLSEFTGLTTRGHIAQMVISGDLPTVFIDNVLFHR
jgi:hypothetical protein